MSGRDLQSISQIISYSEAFLEMMEANSRAPNQSKPPKLFRMMDMVRILEKDRKTIIAAEEKGLIATPERTGGGYRAGYTLDDLNRLRDHYHVRPGRGYGDITPIIAVQSFKGGVGKSVSTVCLSHGLAMRGYRVLVVDMDSQATTTSSFGYIPDHQIKGPGLGIEDEKTCVDFMVGDSTSLSYAIRGTNWSGLDLIPSNLSTYELEYRLPVQMMQQDAETRNMAVCRLREGLEAVRDRYDVVLIDSPPALGAIAMNILNAADCLVVPTPPRMYDVSSTIQFFRMVEEVMERLSPDRDFKWVKVLVTQFDKRLKDQERFLQSMRHCFKHTIMEEIFYSNADIQNAANDFKSPYEFEGTRKQTIEMIDRVVDELEGLIVADWNGGVQNQFELAEVN